MPPGSRQSTSCTDAVPDVFLAEHAPHGVVCHPQLGRAPVLLDNFAVLTFPAPCRVSGHLLLRSTAAQTTRSRASSRRATWCASRASSARTRARASTSAGGGTAAASSAARGGAARRAAAAAQQQQKRRRHDHARGPPRVREPRSTHTRRSHTRFKGLAH